MQQGGEALHCTGLDCDLPDTEGHSSWGIQQEEVHAPWPASQEDPCYSQEVDEAPGSFPPMAFSFQFLLMVHLVNDITFYSSNRVNLLVFAVLFKFICHFMVDHHVDRFVVSPSLMWLDVLEENMVWFCIYSEILLCRLQWRRRSKRRRKLTSPWGSTQWRPRRLSEFQAASIDRLVHLYLVFPILIDGVQASTW
jgi:hypothetical protein